MPKARDSSKRSHLTEAEKRDFDRFGCAFNVGKGVFYIDWRGKTYNQTSQATIFATLGRVDTKEGPVPLLAIEISVVRPLPRYFYFPFDLANPAHTACLTKLTTTGKIKLRFVSEQEVAERVHLLSDSLRMRASQQYEQSLKKLETYGPSQYEFERALKLMERWVRIPEFLEWRLSDDDFRELASAIKSKVQTIPRENRELAELVIAEGEKSLWSSYVNNRKNLETGFRRIREALVCVGDFHRAFDHDPDSFREFLTDAIASNSTPGELHNFREAVKVIGPIIERASESLTKAEIGKADGRWQFPKGLPDLIRFALAARKISPNSLVKIAESLGIKVEGTPGRPTKDYSKEYETKMSGRSWTEVARQAVAERDDLREEFGGRDYDSLDLTHKIQVTNRVRQGVMTYAKRTGQPLPSEGEATEEQKNS